MRKKFSNKKDQEKRDRRKELLIKLIIIIVLPLIIISMFVFCFVLEKESYEPKDKLIMLLVMLAHGVAVLLTCKIIFVIGSSIKTANNKDLKIKKYYCNVGDLKENCKKQFEKINSFSKNDGFYLCQKTPANLTGLGEIYVFAYLIIDESFNEDTLLETVTEIQELNDKMFNKTIIYCFELKISNKYVKETFNNPIYNDLYTSVIFCIYNPEKKELKINKTNSGVGNKFYRDAYGVIKKIFNCKTKKNDGG